MIKTVHKSRINGTIEAIPSKSVAHRLSVCAFLSQQKTKLLLSSLCDDTTATLGCIEALGGKVTREEGAVTIESGLGESAECDCGESGSTLRFLLPVIGALGISAKIHMHGRLPSRPITDLRNEMISHGCEISEEGENPLRIKGKLTSGVYRLPGNVSSQYISGLLFALPLLSNDSEIILSGKTESAPYIFLTLAALEKFSVKAAFEGNRIKIPGNQKYISPGVIKVEGDWSNAAFPLCAAAICGKVTLTGIGKSIQGDRKILDILRAFGAKVEEGEDSVTVTHSPLTGITLDASDIPDLVPVVAVVAAAAEGKTEIFGAKRLKIKESDRLKTVCDMINALGGNAKETEDGIIITPCPLKGGEVDAANDHRIAMSAAVASCACERPVTIIGAEAVNKSYNSFFEDFEIL